MQFTISHRTTYRYREPIYESFSVCHLQPISDLEQYCTRFEINIFPRTRVFHYADRYGNFVHHFAQLPEHTEISIAANSTVTTVRPPSPAPPAPVFADALATDGEVPKLYDFLHESALIEFSRNLHELSASIGEPAGDLVAWYIRAGQTIKDTFRYDKTATNVRTTVAESIRLKAGVCQDYAHVLIALCRLHGIPARYASGYVFSGEGDSLLGAEASHAWCEAYLPPHGWIGYDPTNARLVNEFFVKIAAGRDFRDVSPVRGVYKGFSESTMSVNVAMEDLYSADREAQREEQAAIEAEQRIAAQRVLAHQQEQQQQQQ